jgi:hypothetical protein
MIFPRLRCPGGSTREDHVGSNDLVALFKSIMEMIEQRTSQALYMKEAKFTIPVIFHIIVLEAYHRSHRGLWNNT